jgi:hypothetical protein
MVERFGKNRREARSSILGNFIGQCESRDGDGFKLLQLLHFLQQITAIAIPEGDVTDGQIDSFASCHIQCGLISVSGVDDMPIHPKQSRKDPQRIDLIFHDQDYEFCLQASHDLPWMAKFSHRRQKHVRGSTEARKAAERSLLTSPSLECRQP